MSRHSKTAKQSIPSVNPGLYKLLARAYRLGKDIEDYAETPAGSALCADDCLDSILLNIDELTDNLMEAISHEIQAVAYRSVEGCTPHIDLSQELGTEVPQSLRS